MKGRNSSGPGGVSKGLSQNTNRNDNHVREYKPIFGVSGFVNAFLDKLRDNKGRPFPGVNFTRDRKQTILATTLTTNDGQVFTAKINRMEPKTVNYFRFTAEERYGRDYGKVLCTEKGNPLPGRFMLNRGSIGMQARHYNGKIQPMYVNLKRVEIVEAIGRAGFFKVTRLSFLDNSKTDISISVAAEEYILFMPEELKERFLYTDPGKLLDPVAIEEIIMSYLKTVTDSKQEFAAWEPFIRPMTVAYQKACGQQDAFYLEQETIDLSPVAEVAESFRATLSTGTDG